MRDLLIVGLSLDSIGEEYLSRFAGRGIRDRARQSAGFQSFRDYLGLHQAVDVMARHLSLCRRHDELSFTLDGRSRRSHWSATRARAQRAEPAQSDRLDELVAETPERYLDIAADLAGNPSGSRRCAPACERECRRRLSWISRPFTRHLEQAYRSMWRRWCEDAT